MNAFHIHELLVTENLNISNHIITKTTTVLAKR